jgi:hypothetical protein
VVAVDMRPAVDEPAGVIVVIPRAALATGAAQQQPEADPELETVGERQMRTVRRRGGEKPARVERPGGRQCVVHEGLFRVKEWMEACPGGRGREKATKRVLDGRSRLGDR